MEEIRRSPKTTTRGNGAKTSKKIMGISTWSNSLWSLVLIIARVLLAINSDRWIDER